MSVSSEHHWRRILLCQVFALHMSGRFVGFCIDTPSDERTNLGWDGMFPMRGAALSAAWLFGLRMARAPFPFDTPLLDTQ